MTVETREPVTTRLVEIDDQFPEVKPPPTPEEAAKTTLTDLAGMYDDLAKAFRAKKDWDRATVESVIAGKLRMAVRGKDPAAALDEARKNALYTYHELTECLKEYGTEVTAIKRKR